MPYAQMLFKGQKVFVEVDESGQPLLEGGRAKMKYKVDDEREYRPSPANLVPTDGGTVLSKPALPKAPKSVALSNHSSLEGEAIIAYTDGACSGNPGPAGLGVALTFPDGREVRRGEPMGQGTNNIAELTAILRALELATPDGRDIVIHTDSTYAIGVLTQGWKAKANQELIAFIKKTIAQYGPGRVTFRKVAGHAGVPLNELVDELARRACETQRFVE